MSAILALEMSSSTSFSTASDVVSLLPLRPNTADSTTLVLPWRAWLLMKFPWDLVAYFCQESLWVFTPPLPPPPLLVLRNVVCVAASGPGCQGGRGCVLCMV